MSGLVLVTGATGYIGGRLAPRLVARGWRVRCLVRDPDRLRGVPWEHDVEIVQGDVLQPETLPPALEGVEAAYYLIHAMRGGRRFAERDRAGARHFAEAARAAGVGRVIYLGGIAPKDGRPSEHLRSRLETGEVLRRYGPPLTEFRAAVIVGSGSLSFELVRHLTERVPVMITPRWVRTRTQPIAVRDVLAYLVQALERPETAGRVFEIGGPEVLTYGQMFEGYARVRGLRRVVVPVPLLTPRLSALWTGLVTPVPSAIAHPLIQGLTSEVVVTDPAAREVFDVDPIPYETAVRLALERFREDRVETIWHGALSSSSRSGRVHELTAEAEGLIMDRRERVFRTSAASAFAVAKRIGGATGWLYANPLWRLRGLLDLAVGGPGLRRGRRSSEDLREGEAVDFWRVEAIEPDRLLRLRAEMRLPGRAWLEFRVEPLEPDADGTPRARLTQTAYYEPKGLLGLAYWYALVPVHPAIFRGMLHEWGRRAEGREQAARALAARNGSDASRAASEAITP